MRNNKINTIVVVIVLFVGFVLIWNGGMLMLAVRVGVITGAEHEECSKFASQSAKDHIKYPNFSSYPYEICKSDILNKHFFDGIKMVVIGALIICTGVLLYRRGQEIMRKTLIIFILLLIPASFILADTATPNEPISKEQALEIVKKTLKGPNSDPDSYTYYVTFRKAGEVQELLSNPHNNPTGDVIHDQWLVTIKTKDPWKTYDYVDAQTGKIDCRMGDE